MRKINLTGKRFGRLTANIYTSKKSGNRQRIFWCCLCDCGQVKEISGDTLLRGTVRSCGCLQIELLRNRSLKHGATIGYKESKEYKAWSHAKSRCFNSRNPKFKNYGERGISMCKKWKDNFSEFLKDMGKCPPNQSLDRKNVNGDYEPENCHWATQEIQGRHRTDNVFITYKNETMIQRDWSKRFNIDKRLFHAWLKKGYSMENIESRVRT